MLHLEKTLLSVLPPANEVWGKVIFSQASVILSRGVVCFQGGLYLRGCIQGDGALRPGGWVDPPPPSDTTGYGKQEGVTHPTGMHSCFFPFS